MSTWMWKKGVTCIWNKVYMCIRRLTTKVVDYG